MFSLTLWKIKRALKKAGPGFSMIKKNEKHRITAEVTEEGVRKLSVHHLVKMGEKKYWLYTNYEMCEGGNLKEVHSGKYPHAFTANKK